LRRVGVPHPHVKLGAGQIEVPDEWDEVVSLGVKAEFAKYALDDDGDRLSVLG
jgi:hypothetical protein